MTEVPERLEIVLLVDARDVSAARDLCDQLFEAWRKWANRQPHDADVPVIVGRSVRTP